MWIDPEISGEFDVAIGARVKSVDGENICLIDDDNRVSHLFLLFTSTEFIIFTIVLLFLLLFSLVFLSILMLLFG